MGSLGGSMIYIAGATRWKGTRDEELCFLKNIDYIRIVAENAPLRLISPKLKQLINDEMFEAQVDDEVNKLTPICNFIDKVQSRECLLAEGVHEWLQLKKYPGKSKSWSDRNDMICTSTSLVAYALHPQFKGQLMNNKQHQIVATTLFNNGRNEEMFNAYENFRKGIGLFGNSYALDLSPELYWDLVATESSQLSELALTHISLPSSTASIERVFSMWAFVHDKSRNRLSCDRSEKLIYCYHHLRTHL